MEAEVRMVVEAVVVEDTVAVAEVVEERVEGVMVERVEVAMAEDRRRWRIQSTPFARP